MKNKKLIATVASLCLVLVAVVAAVVGVLAAAQQNVTNHISIRYTANDVYATVSATAWTEKEATVQNLMPDDVEQGDQTYSAAYTFNRTTAQTTKAAKLVDEELGSDNKYVVYKLVFTNNMTGYALNVSGAFTEAAAAIGNDNARLFVKNADTATEPTYNETTGKLSNASSLGEELTTTKAALESITSVAAATQSGETFTPTSDTIFLILCIDDLNVPASYLLGTKGNDTGAILNFTLTRGTKVA